MNPSFHGLTTLQSLDSVQIRHLQTLGIKSLGDLLAYQPFRYARNIRAAKDHLLRKDEIADYLDESIRDKDLTDILSSTAENIKGVGPQTASVLRQLGMETVSDVAGYAPFAEAEEVVTHTVGDSSDPFAPACVLPTCRKFTRNSKSFVSFFRQEEIRGLSVLSNGSSLISALFHFPGNKPKVIHLGYSVSFLQEWIYSGVHLGEPQGSVNLFMGQDTQVSMLDWRRAISALRAEDTRVSERLTSTLFHQRAVDEVARATAEEHQHGGTSAFGANAATAGSFVAAGALVGGVGGGISGALAGLVIGNVANAAGGAPTLAGAAVGTAVGSIAGAAAGSLVFSGATTLGFVEADAEGDREVFAESAQNIQQRTVQNSSSIRSFWSNIISQSVQEEQQRIRTDRVTNHNRIHALNALYFEVLNEYRVNITADSFAPILFLPFKPFHFTGEILGRYWWLIRTLLNDRELVLALDAHFLTLSTDPSPAAQLAVLPEIGAVTTSAVVVEVNLDGSAMQDFFEDAIKATAVLAFLGPLGLAAAVAALIVENLLNESKRRQVKVSLTTANGEMELARDSQSESDPNFVGRYTTSSRIAIHTITGIRITNSNPEFSVGTPEKIGDVTIPHVSFDLNELAFENITAKVTVRDKSSLSQALPNIGRLEDKRVVRSSTLKINANSSKRIPWDIADRLRSQFEGINAVADNLEGALDAEELIAAKIENLLGFLNANKYGFTRFILQSTEREHVISVLEEVEIGGVDLSAIASTDPVGFCGNHVVLLLKNRPGTGLDYGPVGVDTAKLEMLLAQLDNLDLSKPEEAVNYLKELRDYLGHFLGVVATEGNGSVREEQLVSLVEALKAILDGLPSGGAGAVGGIVPSAALQALKVKATAAVNELWVFLQAPVQSNSEDVAKLYGYYGSVKKSLAGKMGKIISSDEISLPSPAIFMEPVLSNAKGAELYDMRRNSHYEILSAPGIAASDPNVIRSQDITLNPNMPGASLTIQNAPEYPLPSSINAALAEAGKLNLGALISSNAGTLNTTLSNLSALATELAKASAQLTGDAQKQALASAGEVAKQIGDIISKSHQGPTGTADAPKPEPPKGQQQKAEVARELDRINKSGASDKEKKEKKETIGAPVAPDEKRDYQMSIQFLDKDGIPYSEGAFEFTLSMSFFEFGATFDINGGAAIPIFREGFFFPETFSLTKGRTAQIRIDASIDSVMVPGIREFPLPDKPDIVFKCSMLTETVKVSSTDVKTAMEQAVQGSSFGGSLNTVFEKFLNAGVEFPFRIFKINADGGGKTQLDLRANYNSSSTDTTGSTTGNTTATEFEIILPKNGWRVEVV